MFDGILTQYYVRIYAPAYVPLPTAGDKWSQAPMVLGLSKTGCHLVRKQETILKRSGYFL